MQKQKTIKTAVSFSGIGLHTGDQTTITFKPAPPDTGVVFIRTDLPNRPEIRADVSHVTDVARGTTIGLDGVKVLTVEHVLAAFAGLGIDNIFAEVDASEAPVGDGSAAPFVKVLMEAGLAAQESPRRELKIKQPISYTDGDITLLAAPADRLTLTYIIEYGHPALGAQYRSFVIEPGVFAEDIAPARTFCFLRDVEKLKALGLIKGGSLENAVVIGDDEILNEKLRFDDEFVRHKVLDLLGDLVLLDCPLVGHIIAMRAGHAAHVDFIKKIRAETKSEQRPRAAGSGKGSAGEETLDVSQIRAILPHRYPFLFVDRITILNEREAQGIKNVSISEPYFQGHIPGYPIMPGVLIIEAIGQVGAVLLLRKMNNAGELPYLVGVEKAKFRKAVHPGDQMEIKVKALNFHKKYGKLRGEVRVDGKLATEAEIIFGMP